MKNLDTKKLVSLAILIALNVVLTRYVSISTPLARIGFSFIVIALTSALYGPWLSGTANVIADLVGMLIAPTGGYFPGFTLSTFISGFVYGVFLHDKPITSKRIVAACFINSFGVSLMLNSLWLYIITGSDIISLMKVRVPQAIFSFFFHVIVLRLILDKSVGLVKKYAN